MNDLKDFSVTLDITYLCNLSSIGESTSESSYKLANILDDKFSISFYSTVDSKLISKGIYSDSDTSFAWKELYNDIEAKTGILIILVIGKKICMWNI